MSQRHNGSTKRKKPQDIQLGILKIYAFSQRIQQKASGPGESAAWVRYLSMRIHPKSCSTFLPKVAATLLTGSRKDTAGA